MVGVMLMRVVVVVSMVSVGVLLLLLGGSVAEVPVE